MFLKSLATNPDMASFIPNKWNADLDEDIVAKRKHKPSIVMDPALITLNNLVFQAIGSKKNKEDFVACDHEINAFKARIWDSVAPMGATKFKNALTQGVKGGLPSSAYLTTIRSVCASNPLTSNLCPPTSRKTIGVFKYMNVAIVKKNFENTITNVETELKNAGTLTKETTGDVLPAAWRAFMKAHMVKIEKEGKAWLDAQIDAATAILEPTLKDYNSKLTALEHVEGKEPHDTEQKALIETKKAAVKASKQSLQEQQAEIVTTRSQIEATNLALLEDEADDTKVRAHEKSLEQYKRKLSRDRRKELRMIETIGKEERAVELMDSKTLKSVIANLEADKKILTEFKTATASLEMPKVA
ncbi:hypothetical protein K504DRAFT_24940 [Pleomassaria siparia CBS 279.74]|uniref:Uncharacterized protein n=1 Tax=Pleomassaria siparia CBS 279.74 TaxID=1314801 RepID=A0A6G1KR62_9PLEO|nr:hypothetical protein K504DRAFT_24940 [Pleomassaria siparia CBS 279.74]